jgi:Raf kinase inhibitor-like YbhB/YbcL family protein
MIGPVVLGPAGLGLVAFDTVGSGTELRPAKPSPGAASPPPSPAAPPPASAAPAPSPGRPASPRPAAAPNRRRQSYAITTFDRDAPTGSGLWHQITWDVPAGARSFDGTLPAGAVSGTNATGATGYLGPCPPAGDIAHHYVISVLALDVPTLGLAADTPAALAAFTLGGHIIGAAQITATAQR